MSRTLGRYELVRPLARGGMAEVFLARRRAAGVEKLLVVKRIRPERAGDARFRELFKREATLSMSLTHQNIVQTFDFGSAGDQFFLAMERVEGKDLGSSLARDNRTPLAPLVAAYIAAECCQALDYAHGRRKAGAPLGVVHRDVTLRNVLVSWSGEVKLTDFGIATLAGEDTSKLVGTAAYMAPEQARAEPIDVRTDVYGVGMVLRELLTGERARPGEDREALVAAAREGTLAPWSGDVDPALVAIVDRATAHAPAGRYSAASEMHADLDAFIVGQRAEHRGDAPARLLAAWLAKVWGDERDDATESAVELEGGAELMSFLDDGAAIGTGTERSLAATAADEPAPAATSGSASGGSLPAASSSVAPFPSSSSASSAAASSPPVASTSESSSPGAPAPSAATSSSPAASSRSSAALSEGVTTSAASPRRLAPVLAVAGVAVIAIVIAVVARGGPRSASPPAPTGSAVALAADAAIESVDAARSTGPADAALVEADAAHAIADATVAIPDVAVKPPDRGSGARKGSGARQGSAAQGSGGYARAGSGSGSQGSGGAVVPPQVVLRKVHINATPWAYFSVDGGPKHQTPKIVELAPGPHQIRFENSVLKVERTITLIVPADRDMSHVEPLR